jgi:hypothetical protein
MQSSAPDDRRKRSPKHVELTKNNKLTYIGASCRLLSQLYLTVNTAFPFFFLSEYNFHNTTAEAGYSEVFYIMYVLLYLLRTVVEVSAK